MRKRIRTITVGLTASALVLAAATGCGQVRQENPGQSEKTIVQTEAAPPAVTEAPVEIQTEAPQTEPQTQPQTQAPETQAPVPETQAPVPETQPQTQASAPQSAAPVTLSEEEELNQLYEFSEGEIGTRFANADINVRTSPSADNADNIVSSLDKGEEATIIGETANWYEIFKAEDSVSGLTDLKGFVMKAYVSDTYEEAMAAQPAQTAAPAQEAGAEPAPAEAAPAAPAPEAPAETPQTSAPVSTASGPQVTVTSDANIRAEAIDTGNVVGVVNAGTTVTQIGSADGWVQVDYNGVQGYIKASMVSG